MRYIKPMLRICSRISAVTAIVAGLSMTAQAADETLTLTCKGTATIRRIPQPDRSPWTLSSTSRPGRSTGLRASVPTSSTINSR